MDPLWSETCWSALKYIIILIVSTYYILCISWIIKCKILKHKVKLFNLVYESGALKFCSMKTDNSDQLLVWIIHWWLFVIWHCYWLQEKSSLCSWRAVMICLSVLRLRVRPHRTRATAGGSDLCPGREGVRTVLCKTASSASNRRRADAADSGHLCFGDRFARRAVRNGGRIHWKINWKSVEARVLVRYRSPGVQEPCEKSVPSSHWFRTSTTVSFLFYTSVLTEEVLPHRKWTSRIKEK